MMTLDRHFSLRRRYSRSINLERDLDFADCVQGYVPASKPLEALTRIIRGYSAVGAQRAWTLTGTYGTGKSAFAHFLTALFSPPGGELAQSALQILRAESEPSAELFSSLSLHEEGVIRAVATARREPISYTVVRALSGGMDRFKRWTRGRRPKVLDQLQELQAAVEAEQRVSSKAVLDAVSEIARISPAGVLLILDELGKNLEFAAEQPEAGDLKLLQDIVELPQRDGMPPILVIGLLHQSFADYGSGLTTLQRNQWGVIQGRFEDIPFAESNEQMMNLLARAIDGEQAGSLEPAMRRLTKHWMDALAGAPTISGLSQELLHGLHPLHPLSAVVLPILCRRYGQNDRSLFSFLASGEPYSFTSFLQAHSADPECLPSLQVHQLYDYFVESAGILTASRARFGHWVEIQGRVADASHLDPDSLRALKTIGVFNLVSVGGGVRASRTLTELALCDDPTDASQRHRAEKAIEDLIQRGLATWRRQADELRVWEGSDFDVEAAVHEQLEALTPSIANLLAETFPLSPLVAQRHSYQNGTLRYFERCYLDDLRQLQSLACRQSDSDGVVVYWLGRSSDLVDLPSTTQEGRPVVLLMTESFQALRAAVLEYVALRKVESHSPQLQTDGVARREVGQRLALAHRVLEDAFQRAFDLTRGQVQCWILGAPQPVDGSASLSAALSTACDRVYAQTPRLWNELINRRELTTQGAKARRELLEAMLTKAREERLGMSGYGPERSMYESLLSVTGLHQRQGKAWGFAEPMAESGIETVWKAIVDFCLSCTGAPQPVNLLFAQLAAPPYGMKAGPLPVLLASVLIRFSDEIGIYQDGSFIPVLSAEHFELLVKHPARFSLKSFELKGDRARYFEKLSDALGIAKSQPVGELRNVTLLQAVRPLLQASRRLPGYTLRTANLSPQVKALRAALSGSKEPDRLLFTELPIAFGFAPIGDVESTAADLDHLVEQISEGLADLRQAYDRLLDRCRNKLIEAFGLSPDPLTMRHELRLQCGSLREHCLDDHLRRFLNATLDQTLEDVAWLESVVMVVADRPAANWRDDDVNAFDIQLTDLARKFGNLEALQKELTLVQGAPFDLRRVTITQPNGLEIRRTIKVDPDGRDSVQGLVTQILQSKEVAGNEALQQALVAALAEAVLGTARPTTAITEQSHGR